MSVARPVYKEAKLMVTRRVRGRVFLLRPSKRTNRIVCYVVAVMSRRTKVRIHAITVMSNHWHLVLTDPEGRICEFTRNCHSFIARAINAAHGDFENLWSSAQTSHVECAKPEDLLDEMAYTMANPVEAGLVRYGSSWPGVRLAWPARPRTVRRPSGFFRGPGERGDWPEVATLELCRPPGYEDLSDDELAAVVKGAIRDREERLREEADREGRRFLGRRAVLAQSRYARPGTREPRFGISPTVACKDKWRRIERLQRKRWWDRDYARALREWVSGNRDAIFPYGTYKMRLLHGVRCAPPPI